MTCFAKVAKEENCEFLPYSQPKRVVLDKDGHIVALELFKMEKNAKGDYEVDEDQFLRVKNRAEETVSEMFVQR